MNVKINDNGAAFLIEVDGLIVGHFSSLGAAWEHIVWMYMIASQKFTVGKNRVPIKDWIQKMTELGWIDQSETTLRRGLPVRQVLTRTSDIEAEGKRYYYE